MPSWRAATIGGMLGPVLDLLAPPRCLGCGRRAALPWCVACARRAAALAVEDPCPRCGAHRGAAGPHPCWRGAAPVAGLHVAYRYRDVVADTVLAAKVDRCWAAWEPLGRLLAASIRRGSDSPALRRADGVAWVPTEPGRRRRRGVDHARRLAMAVADELGLPAVPALRARPGLTDQGQRDDGERARVPDGAFRPTRRLAGRRLLLVDDVVTTGATLSAAAGALTDAGALATGVVLARAGRRVLGRVDGAS